jgi:hypothetical protein
VIPVQPIWVKRIPEPATDFDQRAMTKVVSEIDTAADDPLRISRGESSESSLSMRLDQAPSSSPRGLSGEWARAMVFEIAGAEPASFDSRLSRDAIKSIPLRDALKTPDVSGGALPRGEPAISAQGANDASASMRSSSKELASIAANAQAGEPERFNRFHLPAATSSPWVALFGAAWLNALEAGTAEGNTMPAEPQPLASTARSFGTVDQSNREIVNSSEDDRRHGLVEGIPLLVFLALEWVAVRYWWRTNDEAPAVLAGPPRMRGERY